MLSIDEFAETCKEYGLTVEQMNECYADAYVFIGGVKRRVAEYYNDSEGKYFSPLTVAKECVVWFRAEIREYAKRCFIKISNYQCTVKTREALSKRLNQLMISLKECKLQLRKKRDRGIMTLEAFENILKEYNITVSRNIIGDTTTVKFYTFNDSIAKDNILGECVMFERKNKPDEIKIFNDVCLLKRGIGFSGGIRELGHDINDLTEDELRKKMCDLTSNYKDVVKQMRMNKIEEL